jgi:Asp-tRNA(Asn)/Glu-tRNA(Gln) amidotransferase A subunit family amidase
MLNELATAVRDGRLDPVDLVEDSLRRIAETNDQINAVVALRGDEALEEAARHPRTGALAGLPVLVKDMARCKGMRTTFGSELFIDAPPDDVDDVVVARLKSEGAIVIGRSNTPAFGASAVTVNAVFGPTRNPWNTERSPGGSSGGSSAALAASYVPIATSSDGGGSVRIPASATSLVGYKPSMGAIGRNVLPRWIGFSSQGTLGRTVADVCLEASVIQGPAVGDFLSLPPGAIDLRPQMPRRVIATRSFRQDVDPVIERSFDELLGALESDGVEVTRIDPPSDERMASLWYTIASAELAQSLAEHREKWETFEPHTVTQLLAGERVELFDYLSATRERHALSARFDELLGDDAVLVTPTVNVQSWAAEGPLPTSLNGVENPLVPLNTLELNLTGHPGVSVPMGIDDHGVPVGLQIAAPRFADRLALGLAERLERLRPWPQVADGFELFSARFDLDAA